MRGAMSTGVFVTPHQNDDQGEARDGCDGGRKRCAHSRQSCEDDQAAAEAALLDPDRQGVPIIEVEQHPEIRNREARDAQQGREQEQTQIDRGIGRIPDQGQHGRRQHGLYRACPDDGPARGREVGLRTAQRDRLCRRRLQTAAKLEMRWIART